jgi:uncharacterized membrane protein
MSENLIQHRGQPSIWEGSGTRTPCCDTERWLAAAGSGALLAGGLRRRSSSGLLLVVGAGALAWWATSRREDRVARRARLRQWLRHDRVPADVVAASDEASFPASDAPGWTSSTAHIG